jgi:uncharacterized protein DUF6221
MTAQSAWQWLVAQAQADLDAARAATPGPWTTPGPDSPGQWMIYDSQWCIASATAYDHDRPMSNAPSARGPGYIDADANAAHIATWNPARVIAECEAKLARLERHRPCQDGCKTHRIGGWCHGHPGNDLRWLPDFYRGIDGCSEVLGDAAVYAGRDGMPQELSR